MLPSLRWRIGGRARRLPLHIVLANLPRTGRNIPSLFAPNQWDDTKEDVTEKIKAFYEDNPFPNYDDFDSAGGLIEKARPRAVREAARRTDSATTRGSSKRLRHGQLTNFLSIAHRPVVGTDLCLNSLRWPPRSRQKNDLDRAHFLQMNLFRPAFKTGIFDLVISNGVLHHTSDPLVGFKSISTLVRPGGYMLIGLYHTYGRLATDIRRFIVQCHERFDAFSRSSRLGRRVSAQKRRAWFMDRYKNPHESKHTVGEVIGWLEDDRLRVRARDSENCALQRVCRKPRSCSSRNGSGKDVRASHGEPRSG